MKKSDERCLALSKMLMALNVGREKGAARGGTDLRRRRGRYQRVSCRELKRENDEGPTFLAQCEEKEVDEACAR